MKSTWNLIGMALWLIVIIYGVWMFHDMRMRRIRLIIKTKKGFSWHNFWISCGELAIFLVAFGAMSKVTFFQNVNELSNKKVDTAYSYQPLVLDSDGDQSYYVQVKNSGEKRPIQHYSYLVNGERYHVDSFSATLVTGKKNTNVQASAYKWNQKKLDYMDTRYQRAWVATVTTTYKKNFINGIGLHAGRQANRFELIRIPDNSFIQKNE